MMISRYLGLVLLFFFPFFVKCQQVTPFDTALWHTQYAEALALAKTDSLPLILVFSGSDWCKPCIILHEQVLVTDTFSNWAKTNAVLVSVDFPRLKKNALPKELVKQNEMLAEKFNPEGVFPLFLILNYDEKNIGSVSFHHETPEQFIELINKFLLQKLQ